MTTKQEHCEGIVEFLGLYKKCHLENGGFNETKKFFGLTD